MAVCSLGIGALTGDRVAAVWAGQTWACNLPLGWGIVDSGADWSIAGAFIYRYEVVVQWLSHIWVRGVEGESTQVNAIVRVVVGFDGENCGLFRRY